MIVFNVNHTNYITLLKDLSATVGIPYSKNGDFVILTEPAGIGIIKVLSLNNDLQVLLVNASFRDSLITIREKSDKRYYVLHFDDVDISAPAKFIIDGDSLQKSNTRHSVARLTSNIFTNTEEIPPNVFIKSVKILFNEEWLKKYMELDGNTNLLQSYLMLKTESFDMEPLDATYLKLMDELWIADQKNPMQNLYLQNRVSLLVERFFKRLHDKMGLLEGKFNLTEDDVKSLMKVEKHLTSDFATPPPTIDEFSRMVSMSPTKLKKKFKEMYGDSIYAYYQKLRLQKAKELLSAGKYNVNQTAEAIGYNNTSNFILAFKKRYKKSPGDILVR